MRGFFIPVLSNFPVEKDIMKVDYNRMELNDLASYLFMLVKSVQRTQISQ
jgi:hypothetical protein